MIEERFDRVVVSPQFFFAWDEAVDGIVALAAYVDRKLHLLTCVTFLEPAITMAPPRNQMVLGRALFHRSLAKLTGVSSVFSHVHLPTLVCLNLYKFDEEKFITTPILNTDCYDGVCE